MTSSVYIDSSNEREEHGYDIHIKVFNSRFNDLK